MTSNLWRLGAIDLADKIRCREVSARESTQGVLARIAEVNPRINALPFVMAKAALAAADAADAAQARGDALGPLHGVPVTIKINIDVAGMATTDGADALKHNIASNDSPWVAALRDAGAIAHGNDYGGSVRYPAWACGVVGLRSTVGRIPSYKGSAPNRIHSNQQMSVQGPRTRHVADARLALQVMSRGSALDPQWAPVPLGFPGHELPAKVAGFKGWHGSAAVPRVTDALDQAANWLTDAGYTVELAEPPHFEEAAVLHRQRVINDLQRAGIPAMMQMGDAALRHSLTHYRACPARRCRPAWWMACRWGCNGWPHVSARTCG